MAALAPVVQRIARRHDALHALWISSRPAVLRLFLPEADHNRWISHPPPFAHCSRQRELRAAGELCVRQRELKMSTKMFPSTRAGDGWRLKNPPGYAPSTSLPSRPLARSARRHVHRPGSRSHGGGRSKDPPLHPVFSCSSATICGCMRAPGPMSSRGVDGPAQKPKTAESRGSRGAPFGSGRWSDAARGADGGQRLSGALVDSRCRGRSIGIRELSGMRLSATYLMALDPIAPRRRFVRPGSSRPAALPGGSTGAPVLSGMPTVALEFGR
jgi:hypothetical protein